MARKKSIDTDGILDAAEIVLLRDGIRHFTLDSVAGQAKVSKGGLTYSFPSKEALIEALLTREMTRFIGQIEAQSLAWRPDPQAKLLGYIDATRDEAQSISARAISLLTTLSQAPELMVSVSETYRGALDGIGHITPDERRARLAFFATEGVFLLQGMGILQLTEAERRAILEDAKSLYLLNAPFMKRREDHDHSAPQNVVPDVSAQLNKQARAQKRSAQIVVAASQVIAREGIHGLTHRAVAREANVPLGSTTYYFRDLDDLLNAVVIKAIGLFREEMQRWLILHHEDPVPDMLTAFIMSKINNINELTREYEIFTAAISRPSMRPYALEWSDTVIELLKTVVPANAALPLGTVMNGFLVRGLLEGRSCSLDYTKIHRVISSLLAPYC